LSPLKKNSWRAAAHAVRSPAVNAANFSSPLAGSDSSERICSSCLQFLLHVLKGNDDFQNGNGM
jgi:hypothetical protein